MATPTKRSSGIAGVVSVSCPPAGRCTGAGTYQLAGEISMAFVSGPKWRLARKTPPPMYRSADETYALATARERPCTHNHVICAAAQVIGNENPSEHIRQRGFVEAAERAAVHGQ
jgi:hypothetical protein